MHYIAGMFVRVVVYVSLETVLANGAAETRTVNVVGTPERERGEGIDVSGRNGFPVVALLRRG